MESFLNENYFYFLQFLGDQDLEVMAELNQSWEQRVTGYEIWTAMAKALKTTQPSYDIKKP